MTVHRHTFRKFLLTTFLVSASFGAAHAQDASAVAERFKALMAAQSIDVSWTSASGDASSMTLEGVKIGPAGASKPAEIGKLTFEDVKEENGGYVVGSIHTDAFSKTEEGTTVDVSEIEVTDVKLPAEGDTDAMSTVLFYKTMSVPSVSVKVADKTAFSMENLSVEVTPPAEGKPMEFSGGAEKFSGDLSLAQDPQSKAVIEALGYQNITGKFEIDGTWNPADGHMAISQYDITVDNAGTFGMTFDLGGYTVDFIKSMRQMQKQMAAQPAGADNSAQGLAMLGLMQQLTFNAASIRWDDDSLTNKVIDFVAKQQNMSAADIKNQAKAVVPLLTAQLNDPELSSQVTAAVGKYIDSPKSLEISAKPAAAVPFSQIAAAAMSNPLTLPKTLGLTIEANDGE